MISNLIENTLNSVNVNIVTDIFIILILIILLLSIIWKKQDKHHEFTSYAPNLLTSIGILGTFIGIVIGLLSFNVTNIDGSIENLLNGLKVAFITSLVGMLSSIILKFLSSSGIIRPSRKTEIKEDITIKDLYSVMHSQNENTITIQELLSDSADSSLIGQIKLMRSDISDNNKIANKNLEDIQDSLKQIQSNQNLQIELLEKPLDILDNIDKSIISSNETLNVLKTNQNLQIELLEKPLDILDNIDKSINTSNESLKVLETKQQEQKELFEKFSIELWKQLDNFAEILSKSATEQIIEALKNVISEFNDKLTEQFGQNFKELNSAVKDLVSWQVNYKEQLGEMKDQFNLSVNSMSDMEKSIDNISTSSKSIPDSMNNLEKIIIINQHQVDELSNHLEAFKEIKDKAVEAVPEIRSQIDTTIKGVHEASLGLVEGITSSTDKVSLAIVKSSDDFTNNVNVTNEALLDSSDALKKSSFEIKNQLNLTIQDINKNLSEMMENLSTNSKDISSNFKDISTSLETELSKTNTQMVDNLKTMTDNFASSSKDINKTLSNTSSELQNNIENLSKQQLEQTTKVLNGLDKTIEKTLQDTSKSLSSQIETMDKTAEQEIENVMNAMGKSLASIANQFTSDYQKLVNEMKKIVELNK